MYHIEIAGVPSAGFPSIDADFGRITVILGANGAGKSRLLLTMRDRGALFGPGRPVIYIEGGRTVRIPDQIQLNANTANLYATHTKAAQEHAKKRTLSFVNRAVDAFFVLERRELEEKRDHSDAVTAWQAGGRVGPCPERPEPPLKRLFRMFQEVIPHVTLSYDGDYLWATRVGAPRYHINNLSDGERQVLAILADISILADPQAILLIDEPELNLHPELALSLWTVIESELPNATFVYATHFIALAMRPQVQSLLLISPGGQCVSVTDPNSLDPDELRPFLGAAPGILRGASILLVEGTEKSFDSVLYRWVLRGLNVEIIPVGDCNTVVAATKRAGVWRHLPSTPTVFGLIDRDYRSDDELASLTSASCRPLDLHEAESYLCEPSLIVDLGAKLKLRDDLPSKEDIVGEIMRYADRTLLRTVVTRIITKTRIAANPSVTRKAISEAATEADFLDLLRAAVRAEIVRIQDTVSEDAVTQAFRREIAECKSAIKKRDVPFILRRFAGKELLGHLSTLIGCSDTQVAVTAVKNHLDAGNYENTAALRKAFPSSWTS